MDDSAIEDAYLLPETVGFQCSEKIDPEAFDNHGDFHYEEEDEAAPLPVKFHITLPLRKDNAIRYEFDFGCRRPSFDALTKNEEKLEEGEFEESAADPNFFDKGYTLAGSTGFTVWAGARFMLDALVSANTSDQSVCFWQDRIEAGTRVLELGAGVGLLGTGLAAGGAQVLMTDLPSLVDDAIRPNIRRNAKHFACTESTNKQSSPPDWLSQANGIEAHAIGKGWAAATALDWSRQLVDQLKSNQLRSIDILIASDCAWLASLLDMLLDTVADLFEKSSAPKFLMAFQRRDKNIGSALFTTVDHLSRKVTERRWTMKVIAWRPVTKVDGTETDVRLVEIYR